MRDHRMAVEIYKGHKLEFCDAVRGNHWRITGPVIRLDTALTLSTAKRRVRNAINKEG